MNNTPRYALRNIIAKYGNDLCGDKRRCEGLLKDLCGEFRREINVLTSALEERVPLDLLAAGKSTPRELLLTRLAKRLEDNLGLTPEASNWAVDSWALALGVLTDGELAAKEKKQSDVAPMPTASTPNNKTAAPRHIPSQLPTRTQTPQTSPNKPPPKVYPPVARPPVNLPTPAPQSPPMQQQRRQPNFPQIIVPQPPPQTSQPVNNQPVSNAAPKRRFGFFGCLFTLFLLAATAGVLLFGVPYAIEVMRETQRGEPRRLPQ